MMINVRRIIFWALLSACPFVALFAQISGSSSAKTLTKGGSRASKIKLSARLTLDGYYQTGNTEKSNVSAAAFLSAVDSIKEFSANTKYIYGENNKTVNQKEYNAGIQFDYHPLAVVSPFVRGEFYKNEFKKIKGRFDGLIGVKYRYFVKPEILDYSISAALLFELERYEKDVELPPKERLRLSVRPKFKHNLSEHIYLTAEVFYKPNILKFNDYILCGNININIRAFKQGLIRFSYEHEYNNMPVTDRVRKTDALLLAGLGVNF